MAYQRGTGSVELELSKVQSCLESLDPEVGKIADRVDLLESYRDNANGVLKVIAALQVLIIGILIAMFSWGLNHMTFRADYTEHSSNTQDATLPQPHYVPSERGK